MNKLIFTKCPYCNFESERLGIHIKSHGKVYKSPEVIKDLVYKNIPKEILDNFPEESKTFSLNDFKEKYGLPYEITYYIYNTLGIVPRTLAEANKTERRLKKSEKTCLERYGDTNVLGKKSPIYKKRNETVKNKYGVNNVFQLKEVKEKIQNDELWLKKYGMTRKELQSEKIKKCWELLSDDDKDKWLKKSLWSKKVGCISNLEKNVVNKLIEMGFKVQTQYRIKNFVKDTNSKLFYYDIYLEDYNLLIEVNGNYWHANPNKYSSNDILKFGNKEISVKDIWLHDAEKIKNAKLKKYNIITLWEDEIANKNSNIVDDFENIFYNKINKIILEEKNENKKY